MPKQSDKSAKAMRTVRLKRTSMSCDTCKGRKTKCVDPVPGPCKYCAGVSSPCTITIKRKQRPFYLVSEEEYRYGIKVLQKFFPDIELNLETLRDLAQTLDCDGDNNAKRMASPAIRTNGQDHVNEDIVEVAASTHESRNPSGLSSTTSMATDAHDPLTLLLARQKGSLIIDPLGITRYVGPQSDLFFISAVRARVSGDVQQPSVGRIQHPLRHLPPPPPESRSSITVSHRPTYLPPRQEWGLRVNQYFSEVNSTYWLISSESICSRLDTTYAAQSLHDVPASWLCFLYAVLALTSQTADPNTPGQDVQDGTIPVSTPSSRGINEHLTCDDYISMAKSLIKDVMDEASLDGVRALSAMSIYMHNQGFAGPSYLTTGTAVRIAYTLGLHQPQAYNEMTTLQRENALRIAWTLYQLDCEISRPPGRPCNIDGASWNPIMPSDMAMSSGIYDPWGLTQLSISFNLEDCNMFQKFSKFFSYGIQNTVQHEIDNYITSLQKWYESVPPHLQWNTSVAPPHRRPICRLHLHYFNTIIFFTRFALLVDVQEIGPDQDFKLSGLGQLCLDACEQSLSILDLMRSSNNLSTLTIVDTKYIIDVAMGFLLVLTRWQNIRLQGFLDRCIELLRSMDDVGFCKFAKRDLTMVVEMYSARYRTAHVSTAASTDQEGTCYKPYFADFNMDMPLHQDPLMTSVGWGFFPWETFSGTEDSTIHGS